MNNQKRSGIGRAGVILLSGAVNSGKSTFLSELVVELQNLRLRVAGFISLKKPDHSGGYCYEIMDVRDRQAMILSSRRQVSGWKQAGPFFFNPEALEFGEKALLESLAGKPDLVVIDEVGPLELQDKIWAGAIEKMLEGSHCPLLWVVRTGLVSRVTAHWSLNDPFIININNTTAGKVIEMIRQSH